MKKINESELSQYGIIPEYFENKTWKRGIYFHGGEKSQTKEFIKEILNLKPGEYLFIPEKEWPLKTNFQNWLRTRICHKDCDLYGKKQFISRTVIGGWIAKNTSFQ